MPPLYEKGLMSRLKVTIITYMIGYQLLSLLGSLLSQNYVFLVPFRSLS